MVARIHLTIPRHRRSNNDNLQRNRVLEKESLPSLFNVGHPSLQLLPFTVSICLFALLFLLLDQHEWGASHRWDIARKLYRARCTQLFRQYDQLDSFVAMVAYISLSYQTCGGSWVRKNWQTFQVFDWRTAHPPCVSNPWRDNLALPLRRQLVEYACAHANRLLCSWSAMGLGSFLCEHSRRGHLTFHCHHFSDRLLSSLHSDQEQWSFQGSGSTSLCFCSGIFYLTCGKICDVVSNIFALVQICYHWQAGAI